MGIAYKKGDKVVQIYFPKRGIRTVSRSYWQEYAGGNTSDYTIEFEGGGWDKSTNLKPAVCQSWVKSKAVCGNYCTRHAKAYAKGQAKLAAYQRVLK